MKLLTESSRKVHGEDISSGGSLMSCLGDCWTVKLESSLSFAIDTLVKDVRMGE